MRLGVSMRVLLVAVGVLSCQAQNSVRGSAKGGGNHIKCNTHLQRSSNYDLVSSPVVLSVAGAVPTGGDISLEVAYDTERQRAFVTNSVSNSVSVLDVSDSTNPTVMAIYTNNEDMVSPSGIAFDSCEERLFVSCSGGTLVVLDVSDSSPALVSVTALEGKPERLAFDEHRQLVYVVAFSDLLGPDYLYTVDVRTTKHLSPSVLGRYVTEDGCGPYGVEYDSRHQRLFIACNVGNSMEIVDVREPAVANILGKFSSSNPYNGIVYDQSHNRVFLSSFDQSFVVSVDVSNSAAPFELSKVADSDQLLTGAGLAFDAYHNVVFAAGRNSNSIIAIDVTDPLVMSIVSSVASADDLGRANGLAYDPHSGLLLAVGLSGKLATVDTTAKN